MPPFMPCISDCSLWPDVLMWQHGRGGLRFGGLTGLFYGVQMISSIAHNRRDMQDTIWAALVAGAVMGASGISVRGDNWTLRLCRIQMPTVKHPIICYSQLS